jgi:hypothetical protein
VSIDPVRATRARVGRWAGRARSSGYLLYLAAIALFVAGFATHFSGELVAAIVTCLIVGSILLAPAIVLGYAVKAAEREDRERGL